jgi:hypothetical protein
MDWNLISIICIILALASYLALGYSLKSFKVATYIWLGFMLSVFMIFLLIILILGAIMKGMTDLFGFVGAFIGVTIFLALSLMLLREGFLLKRLGIRKTIDFLSPLDEEE